MDEQQQRDLLAWAGRAWAALTVVEQAAPADVRAQIRTLVGSAPAMVAQVGGATLTAAVRRRG